MAVTAKSTAKSYITDSLSRCNYALLNTLKPGIHKNTRIYCVSHRKHAMSELQKSVGWGYLEK
jgi:hypothetical protein